MRTIEEQLDFLRNSVPPSYARCGGTASAPQVDSEATFFDEQPVYTVQSQAAELEISRLQAQLRKETRMHLETQTLLRQCKDKSVSVARFEELQQRMRQKIAELEAPNASLAQEMAESFNREQRARAQLKDEQQRREAAEQRLATRGGDASTELQLQIENNKTQIRTLTIEKEELESKLGAKTAMATTKKSELAKTQELVKDLQQQLAENKLPVAASKSQNEQADASLQAKIEELSADLDKAKNENRRLTVDLERALNDKNKAKQAGTQATAIAATQRERVKELEAILARYEGEEVKSTNVSDAETEDEDEQESFPVNVDSEVEQVAAEVEAPASTLVYTPPEGVSVADYQKWMTANLDKKTLNSDEWSQQVENLENYIRARKSGNPAKGKKFIADPSYITLKNAESTKAIATDLARVAIRMEKQEVDKLDEKDAKVWVAVTDLHIDRKNGTRTKEQFGKKYAAKFGNDPYPLELRFILADKFNV